MPRVPEERLSWPPLKRFLGPEVTLEDAADHMGIARRNVQHYVSAGVPLTRADAVAVHLGVHPCAIWPDWWTRSEAAV